MSQAAIEVRGLRKSFGEKEAVAGIDLDIAAGSLAGLVGPNGAGKTTSLSMMTGLSIGLTGPPFIVEALALTSRRSLRAYFAGQNFAIGVIAAPLLAAVSVGLAAGVRNLNQAVPATAVALAGLGAALGLANILTVTFAYPMVTRAGSPMRQAAQGYGSYTFGGWLATLAGVAVAVTPVILAAAFTSTVAAAIRAPALIICSAAYGLALAWAGVQTAARVARDRLPELCQIAIQSTGV